MFQSNDRDLSTRDHPTQHNEQFYELRAEVTNSEVGVTFVLGVGGAEDCVRR